MKSLLKQIVSGAMLLALPLMLTGCEDILGKWERPSGPVNPTPGPAPILKYLEWDGTAFVEKDVPEDAIEITSATSSLNSDKLFVVKNDVTITGGLNIDQDASIVLCDGATLTINGAVKSALSGEFICSLTIYGQTNGTGKLVANHSVDDYNAINLLNFTLHGGEVVAKATELSACGIYTSKDIHIYGGKVTAEGTQKGIMINPGGGGKFYMDGGEVVATGTSYTDSEYTRGGWGINAGIIMSGGTLTATGGNSGANAGGTQGAQGGVGINGDITISGGTLNTYGGRGGNGTNAGGGGNGNSGTLYYSGGSVIAIGGEIGTGGGSNPNGSAISNGIKNETALPLSYDLVGLPVTWPATATGTIAAGVKYSSYPTDCYAARVPHE